MKKSKLIIFLVNGKPVETIDGDEITLDGTQQMKTNIAIMHGVSYDEVEVDTEDVMVMDISNTAAINRIGVLLFRADKSCIFWKTVNGIKPAFDIGYDEQLNDWLSLLSSGNVDNAIIFN